MLTRAKRNGDDLLPGMAGSGRTRAATWSSGSQSPARPRAELVARRYRRTPTKGCGGADGPGSLLNFRVTPSVASRRTKA
jgi:hypothetical protein